MESATEASNESASGNHAARLTTHVAITVALLATFLGICKVKDDNIVQAMQQAQTDKLDHWNFYQARNIREEIAAAAVAQLKLASAAAPPVQQAHYGETIASYERLVADQRQQEGGTTRSGGTGSETLRCVELYGTISSIYPTR